MTNCPDGYYSNNHVCQRIFLSSPLRSPASSFHHLKQFIPIFPSFFFFSSACSTSCLTCNGPTYSQCLTCNTSNPNLLYNDNGQCVPSCGNFQFAPVGSYICQTCNCNGWSTLCVSTGQCLCHNNTAGDNCELCTSGYQRAVSNPTYPCLRTLLFHFQTSRFSRSLSFSLN